MANRKQLPDVRLQEMRSFAFAIFVAMLVGVAIGGLLHALNASRP